MDIYSNCYNWLIAHLENASKYSGGEQRAIMGNLVEEFVDLVFREVYPDGKFQCVIGSRIPIKVTSKNEFSIQESVDRHIYKDGKLIAAIECKTYLDKCYLQRADSDFHLLKSSNSFLSIILSIQNSVSKNSEMFFLDQENIDNIFYLSDVKRSSERHISKHSEWIDFEKVKIFIDFIRKLGEEKNE